MAKFNFKNLTTDVRTKMLDELNADVVANIVYLSNRLTDHGKDNFVDALKVAFTEGDEETLQVSIESDFNSTEIVNEVSKKVPSNASQLLSQGEFNRYYIRGLCLWSLQQGNEELEIYRARVSSSSRPNSEQQIGLKINASLLLDDLRKNIGRQPELLPEVNSGLSVFI